MALNAKQSKFVAEYLRCFNATRAAINAGYSERSARAIGHENLTKPDIWSAIQQHLNEAAMSADEVLMRLAEHARGDIDNYIDDLGNIDLNKARRAKKTGTIKKIRRRRKTYVQGDEDVIVEDVEIELYDALSALEKLGRYHKLFTESVDLSGGIEIREHESATERILSRIDSIATRIKAADDVGGTGADGEGAGGT